MPKPERRSGLYARLKTELDSVGRGLSRSMQQVLAALERRNGTSEERLLDLLEDLRKSENNLKETCLEILAGRSTNTPELRWTGCAHRILLLMSKASAEISSIARQIGKINDGPALPIAGDLPEMARLACRMLDRSIQTALDPDPQSARRVMEEDSFLDRHKEDFTNRAICFVNEHPEGSRPVVPYVLVSRHLERIGDHASHIAEEVAYYLQEQAA